MESEFYLIIIFNSKKIIKTIKIYNSKYKTVFSGYESIKDHCKQNVSLHIFKILEFYHDNKMIIKINEKKFEYLYNNIGIKNAKNKNIYDFLIEIELEEYLI